MLTQHLLVKKDKRQVGDRYQGRVEEKLREQRLRASRKDQKSY